MIVVNIFGGPGAGKSLNAFGLTYHLKRLGVNADFVPEYAKELVYGEDWQTLADQSAVLDEQYRRLVRLAGKVDIAVTDGSLLLSLVYGNALGADRFSENDAERTRRLWRSFDNTNFLIQRSPEFGYETTGRYQDEAGANEVDRRMIDMLKAEAVGYTAVATGRALPRMLEVLGFPQASAGGALAG